MGSCAAPSAKGDDKFITTDYLQQCPLFWQWGERFPSLAGMERWQWQDMPFWQVIAEAGMAARVVGHAVREMERWMVPNKLREAA